MMESLGNRLKQLRQNNRLRQDQVASLVGVNKNTMCSYENDVRQPSYEILVRLATIYRVSTDYLLGCESKRTVDVSGLTPKEIQTITELVADMTEKNKKLEGLWMAQNEKEQNDYRITYYNAVSSKEVDWLWYPYIPYGKITILQGDPGEGKSTMMMQLAALITTGKAMPDGSGDKIPGNVIYQAAEDGIEDTIKPRLEAAGADCSRIAFLEQPDEEPILLNDTRLAQAIEGTQAKLLVIDPLQAYLRMDSEIQRTNSVRSVLTNLAKVAERTGCAVVLIGHMNKSNRTKGIYRGLGSIDIAAVARSILLVGRDRNIPHYRVMLQIKNNLAPEGKAYVFELHPDLGFRWIGQEEYEVEDLLSHKSKTDSKLDKAKDYLQLLLSGTDMACADIFDKMRANGIGKRTVEQAKKDMGIISYKLGDKWYWQLNGSDASGERI